MKKNYDDLIGEKFNRLTILEIFSEKQGKYYRTMAKCQCECETIKTVRLYDVIRGVVKSCGCAHSERAKSLGHSNLVDLTGKRFNKLTVIERAGSNSCGTSTWLCQCDCGNLCVVDSSSLTRGTTKSCGCLNHKITHGESKSKIYKVWSTMKQRCDNSNSKHYKNYGGRGITVYEEWKNNFQIFYNWAMANGYQEGLTIDRINVDGNYEPNNCRWVSRDVQANNTRRNVSIAYKNETHTIGEWAKLFNIDYNSMYHKLNSGWSMDKIISEFVA